MTASIVVVPSFARFILAPDSEIDRVLLLGEFGGVPVIMITLSLGLLILVLIVISPNRHLQTFSFPPSSFLW